MGFCHEARWQLGKGVRKGFRVLFHEMKWPSIFSAQLIIRGNNNLPFILCGEKRGDHRQIACPFNLELAYFSCVCPLFKCSLYKGPPTGKTYSGLDLKQNDCTKYFLNVCRRIQKAGFEIHKWYSIFQCKLSKCRKSIAINNYCKNRR